MLRIILSIVALYFIYTLGKDYSNTFFAGWVAALVADLVVHIIKLVCETETK